MWDTKPNIQTAKITRILGWFLTVAGLWGGSLLAVQLYWAQPPQRLRLGILIASNLAAYLGAGGVLLAIHPKIRKGQYWAIMAAIRVSRGMVLCGIVGISLQAFSYTRDATVAVFAVLLTIISVILARISKDALSRLLFNGLPELEPSTRPAQAPTTYRHSISASSTAASTARIIGWLYLVLGLVLVSLLLFPMVMGDRAQAVAVGILMLIVTCLYVAPAVALLLIYPKIERGQMWATITAMLIGLILALCALLASLNLIVQEQLLTAIPPFLLLVSATVLAVNSIRAMRRIQPSNALPWPSTPSVSAPFRLPPRPQR